MHFLLGCPGLHSGLKQYRDPLKTPFLVFENCLFEEKVLKMHEYCKNVEFGKRKKNYSMTPPAGFEPGTFGSKKSLNDLPKQSLISIL